MKKITLGILFIFAFISTQAQVTFNPGFRAGVNFANLTNGDYYGYNENFYYDLNGNPINFRPAEFTTKTDFYVGIYGALRLTKYYTLQPEINYSRQGANIESDYVIGNTKMRRSQDFKASYISVGVINKFTFNRFFNVHIGPTVDILTAKQNNRYYEEVYDYNYAYNYYGGDTATDIDLAFVFGLGINFTKNFGFEARVKKGIIPVIDSYEANHTNIVFSAGLNYTFDLK